MDIRLNSIKAWLTGELKLQLSSIAPASADASFRRYFRADTPNGSFIIMDAPPEKESITEFVEIAQALANIGVHTPEIKAKDLKQGFLLLEDLGDCTYLDVLRDKPNELYRDAIDSLVLIQQGHNNKSGNNKSTLKVPAYDAEKLEQEMDLFEHWYVNKHLNLELNATMKQVWQETKGFLIQACLEQPQTWVHRDFHSRNLMVTKTSSPGVIDFQDMVLGPLTYDLASIFKDCYIEWPRQQQLDWLEEYRLKASLIKTSPVNVEAISSDQLIQWFDLTGLQRHLKVLGIFCRLYYRDAKDQYINDLPLVAKYTLEALTLYPQLASFNDCFGAAIKASLNESKLEQIS